MKGRLKLNSGAPLNSRLALVLGTLLLLFLSAIFRPELTVALTSLPGGRADSRPLAQTRVSNAARARRRNTGP